jgi:hypothetical protein
MTPDIEDPDLAHAHLMEKLSQDPEYDPNRAVNMRPPTRQQRIEMMAEIDRKQAETIKRMQMYDQSSEILDLIKQRLASGKDTQLQDYLESKLETNK